MYWRVSMQRQSLLNRIINVFFLAVVATTSIGAMESPATTVTRSTRPNKAQPGYFSPHTCSEEVMLNHVASKDTQINTKHGGLDKTLLHYAGERGFTRVIEELGKITDFDVNATNKNGETALFGAARYGQLEAIKALQKISRFTMHATDTNGETALFTAVRHRQLDTVKFLVMQAGADSAIKNKRKNKRGDVQSGNVLKVVDTLLKEPLLKKKEREDYENIQEFLKLITGLKDGFKMVVTDVTLSNEDLEWIASIAYLLHAFNDVQRESIIKDWTDKEHAGFIKNYIKLYKYFNEEQQVALDRSVESFLTDDQKAARQNLQLPVVNAADLSDSNRVWILFIDQVLSSSLPNNLILKAVMEGGEKEAFFANYAQLCKYFSKEQQKKLNKLLQNILQEEVRTKLKLSEIDAANLPYSDCVWILSIDDVLSQFNDFEQQKNIIEANKAMIEGRTDSFIANYTKLGKYFSKEQQEKLVKAAQISSIALIVSEPQPKQTAAPAVVEEQKDIEEEEAVTPEESLGEALALWNDCDDNDTDGKANYANKIRKLKKQIGQTGFEEIVSEIWSDETKTAEVIKAFAETKTEEGSLEKTDKDSVDAPATSVEPKKANISTNLTDKELPYWMDLNDQEQQIFAAIEAGDITKLEVLLPDFSKQTVEGVLKRAEEKELQHKKDPNSATDLSPLQQQILEAREHNDTVKLDQLLKNIGKWAVEHLLSIPRAKRFGPDDIRMRSPLMHLIATSGDISEDTMKYKMIEYLIKRGVDLSEMDHEKRTVLRLAIDRDMKNVIKLLLSYGAQVTDGDIQQAPAELKEVLSEAQKTNKFRWDNRANTLQSGGSSVKTSRGKKKDNTLSFNDVKTLTAKKHALRKEQERKHRAQKITKLRRARGTKADDSDDSDSQITENDPLANAQLLHPIPQQPVAEQKDLLTQAFTLIRQGAVAKNLAELKDIIENLGKLLDETPDILTAKNKHGDLLLHNALRNMVRVSEKNGAMYLPILELLVRKGCDVNSINTLGETPLLTFIRLLSEIKDKTILMSVFNVLLPKEINIGYKDQFGDNLLHRVIRTLLHVPLDNRLHRNVITSTIKALIKQNIEVNGRNADGVTPLQLFFNLYLEKKADGKTNKDIICCTPFIALLLDKAADGQIEINKIIDILISECKSFVENNERMDQWGERYVIFIKKLIEYSTDCSSAIVQVEKLIAENKKVTKRNILTELYYGRIDTILETILSSLKQQNPQMDAEPTGSLQNGVSQSVTIPMNIDSVSQSNSRITTQPDTIHENPVGRPMLEGRLFTPANQPVVDMGAGTGFFPEPKQPETPSIQHGTQRTKTNRRLIQDEDSVGQEQPQKDGESEQERAKDSFKCSLEAKLNLILLDVDNTEVHVKELEGMISTGEQLQTLKRVIELYDNGKMLLLERAIGDIQASNISKIIKEVQQDELQQDLYNVLLTIGKKGNQLALISEMVAATTYNNQRDILRLMPQIESALEDEGNRATLAAALCRLSDIELSSAYTNIGNASIVKKEIIKAQILRIVSWVRENDTTAIDDTLAILLQDSILLREALVSFSDENLKALQQINNEVLNWLIIQVQEERENKNDLVERAISGVVRFFAPLVTGVSGKGGVPGNQPDGNNPAQNDVHIPVADHVGIPAPDAPVVGLGANVAAAPVGGAAQPVVGNFELLRKRINRIKMLGAGTAAMAFGGTLLYYYVTGDAAAVISQEERAIMAWLNNGEYSALYDWIVMQGVYKAWPKDLCNTIGKLIDKHLLLLMYQRTELPNTWKGMMWGINGYYHDLDLKIQYLTAISNVLEPITLRKMPKNKGTSQAVPVAG
jgi:ankyrin repeat protein/ferritin-like metal-binding protein YciE